MLRETAGQFFLSYLPCQLWYLLFHKEREKALKTSRPTTMATRGMVSSPHYLASLAGLSVLQNGGSAVDAAIAVNATLGVVYPHMTGMGGDAFWLIYDAESDALHALNGSGRSAAAATREFYRKAGHEVIPARGAMSAVTVPGAVDSWCTRSAIARSLSA